MTRKMPQRGGEGSLGGRTRKRMRKDGDAKLRALSQLATTPQGNYGGVGAEPAIRAWARADKNVAAALARVDTTRLAYLQEIFTTMDMANPDLPHICYASLIGLQELSDDCDSTGTTPMATLVDLMIALAKTD